MVYNHSYKLQQADLGRGFIEESKSNEYGGSTPIAKCRWPGPCCRQVHGHIAAHLERLCSIVFGTREGLFALRHGLDVELSVTQDLSTRKQAFAGRKSTP